MAKFQTAADILKAKDFYYPPFNTGKFMNVVTDFFLNHEVGEKLQIFTGRFVDFEPPADGFLDWTAPGSWEQGVRDGFIDENSLYAAQFNGWAVPTLWLIDAYCKNAVGLLVKLGGFVVTKKRKGSRTLYYVSLV